MGRCATAWNAGLAHDLSTCARCDRPRRRYWHCSRSPVWDGRSRISPPRSPTTVAPLRHRRAGRLITDAPSRIRPARDADLPALVALERIAFTDPWSRGDFADCLRNDWPIYVAENGAAPVGYIVGRSVVDEGEILNLGVTLAARRRGIGTALVRRLLDEFSRRGVVSAFLEVRESNTAAQRLYESFGFAAVGRRARYYQRPMEDAVVLRAAISADTGSA